MAYCGRFRRMDLGYPLRHVAHEGSQRMKGLTGGVRIVAASFVAVIALQKRGWLQDLRQRAFQLKIYRSDFKAFYFNLTDTALMKLRLKLLARIKEIDSYV